MSFSTGKSHREQRQRPLVLWGRTAIPSVAFKGFMGVVYIG